MPMFPSKPRPRGCPKNKSLFISVSDEDLGADVQIQHELDDVRVIGSRGRGRRLFPRRRKNVFHYVQRLAREKKLVFTKNGLYAIVEFELWK